MKYWPIVLTAAGLIGVSYVAHYRLAETEKDVAAIEADLKAADVKHLSRQVASLKCDVKNLKKILQQKPEVDCD
jgi:hypothetical protein